MALNFILTFIRASKRVISKVVPDTVSIPDKLAAA